MKRASLICFAEALWILAVAMTVAEATVEVSDADSTSSDNSTNVEEFDKETRGIDSNDDSSDFDLDPEFGSPKFDEYVDAARTDALSLSIGVA